MRVDDDYLREVEAMAAEVDALDRQASQGPQPHSDVQLDATLVAKRGRLLLELDTAEVLLSGERTRLSALGLTGLLGYCDAAAAMARYWASPGYARLVKVAAPERVLDAPISLDWFRQPSGYTPANVSDDDWLALCEANFRANPREGAGTLFVRLQGSFHQLHFRIELDTSKLYRALPA